MTDGRTRSSSTVRSSRPAAARSGFVVDALLALVLGVVAATAASGQATGTSVEFDDSEIQLILHHSPLGDVPADPTNAFADDEAALRLGRALFFDTRLSGTGEIACATCHVREKGWSNGEALGHGIGETSRHVPTLWNVGYNRWYFWDGRADSLWSQALQPLENPVEQGTTRLEVARLVLTEPALREAYREAFGEAPARPIPAQPERARPVPGEPDHVEQVAWSAMRAEDRAVVNRVFANVGKAIAAFERTLVTRDAPFDVFAEGLRTNDPAKLAALGPMQQRGLKVFLRSRCWTCHVGPNFTDGEFHDLGLLPSYDPGRYGGVTEVRADPFNANGSFSDDPSGGRSATRFLVRRAENHGQFKTPTLRNVAESAPYMHDGRFADLESVVRFYSTLKGTRRDSHQHEGVLAPLELGEGEIQDLVAFLRSLTGDAAPGGRAAGSAP